MLRIGFLPSDFNPMVLLLGEAEDFRALAGTLRQFARAPAPIRLDRLAFAAEGSPPLILTPARDRPGIARPGIDSAGVDPMDPDPPGIARDGTGLTWRLDPDRALRFAGQLDGLADPAVTAGSEMLECSTEAEIPVKASRGEYTDDFLSQRDAAE